MKLNQSKLSSGPLSSPTLARAGRHAKTFAAILRVVTCLGLPSGLHAVDDPTLNELPPEIFEWYPYEPVTVAVNDELVLFGDVDDFGGGLYTCYWQSDRKPIETQTVEATGSDWINFKSSITYKPKLQDVGVRTLTLTVLDPDGHTDVQTYVVNVISRREARAARSAE